VGFTGIAVYSAMTQSGDEGKLDSDRLLSEWRWLCPETLTVFDRNVFGDLFLTDELGRVHLLNVGSGELAVIAESVSEFRERAKTPAMQEAWFTESAARSAEVRGLVPGAGQCIGFSTPTVFKESGGLESAFVADLYEHVGFLGDIHRQISTLPDGAKVRLVVQHPPGGSWPERQRESRD
jgi:hypothetical protein